MGKLAGFEVSLHSTLLILTIATISFMVDDANGDKEVLVRDRLVFLLCDQMGEYMSSGKFPEPIKVMPEKYKKMKPGSGAVGRSFGIKKNKTKKGKNKGKKNKEKNKNKFKREVEFDPDEHLDITILDLFDDE